jgi:hypothetical protein
MKFSFIPDSSLLGKSNECLHLLNTYWIAGIGFKISWNTIIYKIYVTKGISIITVILFENIKVGSTKVYNMVGTL